MPIIKLLYHMATEKYSFLHCQSNKIALQVALTLAAIAALFKFAWPGLPLERVLPFKLMQLV